MPSPPHPVTLSPEQIEELSVKLSNLRHNVNNHLSLVIAAAELMRHKPENAARLVESLFDPPERITHEVRSFSDELERLLGIPRN